MTIDEKKKKLEEILRESKKILIAYSGGVDSTFLLKFAVDCLGAENVGAFIEKAEIYPENEVKFAEDFARELGVKVFIYFSKKLADKTFNKNPVDRCFYCKKDLFSQLANVAKKEGFNVIADGSNFDDVSDYRPGNRAKSMFGVISPLQLAEFRKKDIRELSRKMGLPTWNKPQMACLSSRIPYGEKITKERLSRILKAEEYLRKSGFWNVRVRDYNNMCRIEVSSEDIAKIVNLRRKIIKALKEIGYTYITLDLEGYRTGSMNISIISS
ncbi:MAG: ATP-dependent sacrificial sulfur transferase LarE [Candidatus Omnitrophica bacterium]|nr:ATP-dependent sacrificial sulfur transferase LarE [Candidatus Omnitrophota bacterium]